MPNNKCAIFDLDGTIANNAHRLHYILETPKNWPAFFDACVNDTVHEYIRDLCNAISAVYPVMICSGRPNSHWTETTVWLQKYKVNFSQLLMRTKGDHRPDYVIKKEMLDRIRRDGWDPIFAVDDRPSVVEMWRENGVPCLVADDRSWFVPGQEDDEG